MALGKHPRLEEMGAKFEVNLFWNAFTVFVSIFFFNLFQIVRKSAGKRSARGGS